MLILTCPWCDERPEGEFMNIGEAVSPRTDDPAEMTDSEWSASIVSRNNIRGRHTERWWHMRGCGIIFKVDRDTVTHDLFDAAGEVQS
jgi:sarcosine oxidase, subunit delta